MLSYDNNNFDKKILSKKMNFFFDFVQSCCEDERHLKKIKKGRKN